MNPTIDDRLMDRLVDDELDAEERRQLLARLDSEPNGWRRCALAFLESQSWERTVKSMPQASVPLKIDVGGTFAVSARRRVPIALTGLAAGLLLSFCLGWTVAGTSPWRGPRRPSTEQVTAAPVIQPAPVKRPDQSSNGSPQVAKRQSEEPLSDEHPTRPGPLDKSAVIAGGVPTVRSLPEPVRRQWERRGYQIQEQRGLMAVKLKDGRRVAVPVEELKFHYVGRPTL